MLRSAALLTLGLVVWGHCQDTPTVEAVATDGPTQIDGELFEPTWQAGEFYTGFSMLDKPEQAAEYQTRFKVRFDDAALYIAAVLDEPAIGKLKADATERDGKVYSDDCLEVMLDPTGERVEYYHFIVNPRGTIYDAQMRQGGNVRSYEWNCGVQAAATVGESSWTVEIAIPVVELGLTAASKGDWALNVTRERRADGEELSSFVPITGGFHQPSLYATLKLPGADFSRYLWEVKTPYEARVEPNAEGRLIYRAKTHLTNFGARFSFVQLRGVLGNAAGDWVPDGLDAGQGREYEFAVPVQEQGPQTLQLQLADRSAPDDLLALRSFIADISYTPIAIDVVRPWYRDSIYATENLPGVVADIALSVPERELGDLALRAELCDAAGGVVGDCSAVAARQQQIEIPLPTEMAVGDYTLSVALLRGEQEAYRVEKTIRKLPAVEDEWRLSESNVLLHNGEPVLPFGWFSIPARAMAEPGHAYQLMQAYSSYYFPVEKVRADLDEIVAANSHVTIYPYQSPRMVETEAWGKPLTEEEAEGLRARVAALKDHPGIFAWYMADEPELRPALVERCRQLREVVAQEDPFHPTIMLNDTIAGVHKYIDGGDITMPDPYPCFIKGGLAAQPIEKTGEFIKACQEASRGRRGIWATPQAFNYGDYGRKNQRGPTLTELRNQLYQAVIYGAKGFLWYTHSQVNNYPDLWVGMPWLSFEVADLKSAILADPAEEVKVAVDAPQPRHIHVSPRRVDGNLYLFVVNTATEPQEVRLTIAPAPGLRSLYVVSEQRNVPLTEGTQITDTFDTYETHIYTTDAEVGGRASIAEAAEQIRTETAALKKPGNLAYEDSGAEVEVSSRSTYGSTPDRLLDGVETGMLWRDGTRGQFPDWAQVRWPQAQTIGRVVLHTPTVASFEVQVPEGDDWKTVVAVEGNAEQRVEAVLPQAVQTEAIRILVTGIMADKQDTEIWEVEAYAN